MIRSFHMMSKNELILDPLCLHYPMIMKFLGSLQTLLFSIEKSHQLQICSVNSLDITSIDTLGRSAGFENFFSL